MDSLREGERRPWTEGERGRGGRGAGRARTHTHTHTVTRRPFSSLPEDDRSSVHAGLATTVVAVVRQQAVSVRATGLTA